MNWDSIRRIEVAILWLAALGIAIALVWGW